ncbi:hypothetical protein [Tropicimonas marinistellae]|uniref:hypothetical protein n=1 Tax=Tropicimonas marinistellae TaxID=1739787 RepID=UPI000A7B8DE3|nr:hypothetical protein [Tropicimonas marinistellae]
MRAIVLAVCLPLLLGACTDTGPWATDQEVQAAAFRDDGPPTITLFTMINNRSHDGAHSGLMISGSQRIIFDPAGTFYHPHVPQRADVHYGITDSMVDFYIDYHARETYHVVRHDVVVTPEQAEIALQRAQAYGAVSKAFCTTSIHRIVRGVPGFESIPASPRPKKVMRAFDEIPGATIRRYYDDSPDDRSDLITDSPKAREDIRVVYGPEPSVQERRRQQAAAAAAARQQ